MTIKELEQKIHEAKGNNEEINRIESENEGFCLMILDHEKEIDKIRTLISKNIDLLKDANRISIKDMVQLLDRAKSRTQI